MDEVSLLLDLLSNNWSTNATALVSDGTISASHAVTPDFIDIRTMTANKGVRVDLSRTPATIVVFEDSQSIDYPTIHYDIRNETYSFTLHIRVLHDERGGADASYGKDRLRAIYLILRRTLERAKRLFGYKVTLEAKRFAQSIP